MTLLGTCGTPVAIQFFKYTNSNLNLTGFKPDPI